MSNIDNYIVLDKRVLKQRIAELSDKGFNDAYVKAVNQIIDIIANSKPLRPLIENSFENGMKYWESGSKIDDYISKLEL